MNFEIMDINTIEQMHLPLADKVFAVHCFFNCSHVARSADPYEAGRLMEQHYAEKHTHQIDRIVARLKGWEKS